MLPIRDLSSAYQGLKVEKYLVFQVIFLVDSLIINLVG
jgi:hypothetical protein